MTVRHLLSFAERLKNDMRDELDDFLTEQARWFHRDTHTRNPVKRFLRWLGFWT
jgi:hypothetical protein